MKYRIYFFIASLQLLVLFSACSTTNVVGNGSVTSCDQVIDKEYYEICYDYDLKGALFVSYSLDGDNVDKQNLTDRPSFYTEPTLYDEYVSEYNDYVGSGYDRGHLASDASFDWSYNSLDSVYSMANIIPQYPEVNRKLWIQTEYYERKKALEYGSVDVLIGVIYSDNPQQIGENFISVPLSYYKFISNEKKDFKECYLYENISSSSDENLQDHKVDCHSLVLDYI